MVALSRVSACRSDDLADPDDVRAVRSYPSWQTNTAWSALRRSIGMDSTAFFRTMSLRTGDVLALLRSLRAFYERRSVPFQTQLRKDLLKMTLSDYPDWKRYVAAMDIIFTKLRLGGACAGPSQTLSPPGRPRRRVPFHHQHGARLRGARRGTRGLQQGSGNYFRVRRELRCPSPQKRCTTPPW